MDASSLEGIFSINKAEEILYTSTSVDSAI
jgi:hypothetical protein